MSIAYGGILAFFSRGLNLVVALALVFLTSRQLTPEQYGAFVLGLTVIGIVKAMTGGLTAAVAFQVANRRRPPGTALANGLAPAATLGGLAVVAGLLAGATLGGRAGEAALPVGLAAAAVIVNSVIAGAYLGREAFVRYNLVLVAPPALALVAIALTFFASDERTPAAALWAYAAGQWTAAIILVVAGQRLLLQGLRLEAGLALAVVRFALFAGVSSAISYLNYRADQFVVLHFEGEAGVGTYSLAVYIAESVWQVSGSLALAAYARIGALSRPDAVALTTRIMRHTVLMLAVVCAALFLVADLIQELLFGEYEGMSSALRFLLPGVLLYGLAQSYSGYYTYQRGLPWVAALVAGTGLVLNIALAFLLVPPMGVEGAALATTIAYSVAIVAALAVFIRREGVGPAEVFRFGRADLEDYRALLRRVRALLRPPTPPAPLSGG